MVPLHLAMAIGAGVASFGVWFWAGTDTGSADRVAALCKVHARLDKSNPLAEPPTLFEFLHLDVYAFPFYPREVSLHTESRAYPLAKESILLQAQLMSEPLYKELYAAKDKRDTVSWSENLTADEHVAAVAHVARALFDDSNRKVYIEKFLPVLTSYKWWDPFKIGWGRKKWEEEVGGRRKRLTKFCGWKS